MPAEFVHLHVHSQYSFLTSAVKLSDLPGKARELGMRGVALTDVANMYGAIRHYKGCQDKGLTPILGAEVFIPRTNASGALDHLVLLAESQEGYRNLVRIVSEGHLRSAHDYAPAVTLDFITERNKGLIALSGCMAGLAAHDLAKAIYLEEGSGLSHGNRFTARGLVKVLNLFAPHAGLLDARKGASYKTGTLEGVRTLAGYTSDSGDGRMRFVIALKGNNGAMRFELLKAIESGL